MPEWVQILLMAATAGSFAVTAIVTVLTYRRAGKVHEVVNHNRRETNEIVGKVGYITGRQDALLRVLHVSPEQLHSGDEPPPS